MVPAGAGGEGGQDRLHLDLYPTGRDGVLLPERRVEIIEAKVAELVGLGASVARRTGMTTPMTWCTASSCATLKANESCVS